MGVDAGTKRSPDFAVGQHYQPYLADSGVAWQLVEQYYTEIRGAALAWATDD